MKVIFRVECGTQAGYVEVTLENVPFLPVKGMRIAPLPEADLLEVDEVYWMASEPDVLEVWLIEDGDLSDWDYFKKQGYKKGQSAARSAA